MTCSKWLIACAAALCMASQTACGADEGEWITLFNGKNMDGWKVNENEKTWSIEDGALKAVGERSHCYYVAREFKNFEFKAMVKTLPGSNGGIYFHSKYQESGWPENGHEIQVNVSQGDPVRTGSVYNVVKLYETPAKDNEWWEQHITVKGKNIVVRINGKVVADYTEPPGEIEGGRKISEGLFALQGHDPGSTIYYKDIKARPLD